MAIRRATVIRDIFVIAMVTQIKCASPGYLFSKFMGPVSGIEQKVEILDDGKYKEHDYIAKPDYHFEYGVEDPKSNVHQKRKETRLGDTVHGEYSVLDPDGKLRTVKYKADKENGFQASVITDGHVMHIPPVVAVDYDEENHIPESPHVPNVPEDAPQLPHLPPAPHVPHIPQVPHRPKDDESQHDSDDDEYNDGSSKNDDGEEDGEEEDDKETDETERDGRSNNCENEDEEYSNGCESGSEGESTIEDEGEEGGSEEESNADDEEYY